jgi:protein-S-isoprenylcysteine O-methyltransferase Ste14
MTVLRHTLSILLLPFVAVVAVPWWLLTQVAHADTRWSGAWPAGLVLFACGFAFFAWCIALFARVGQGTLAPWDPTRRLVAVGPYRHVRNPMISGVAAMLFGEALTFGSGAVALWALLFVLVNHVYFIVSEEPGLERRFGDSYRAYRANVPRWLPRRTPWEGG